MSRSVVRKTFIQGSGVAQLAERLLPIPEVRMSNTYLLLTVEKMKIKKKEAGNGPIFFIKNSYPRSSLVDG